MAPDIQKAILTGRQPKPLTLGALTDVELSPLWSQQRSSIGAPSEGLSTQITRQ